MTTLEDWKKTVAKGLVNLERARATARMEKKVLRTLEAKRTTLQETQILVQSVATEIQSRAHARVSEIVTRCLRAVFDDPYEFRIEFERKRGKTEARLLFSRGGLKVDPLTASGGGVVDVAAFALRLACLVLSCPGLRKVLVLDEPFRFVSAGYRDRVRQLLEELSRELGMQIVQVTHVRALQTGSVFVLSKGKVVRLSSPS